MADGLAGLARGTLIYGAGSVLNRAFAVLLLPVLTAYLNPADYGIVAILDVLAASLIAVFSLGFGTSMTISYFHGTEPGHRESTVATAFALLLASCTVLGSLALAGSVWISRWILEGSAHSYLVRLCLAATALNILSLPFTLRLQFEGRARLQVSLTLLSAILTAGLSLVGVVALGRGVTGLLEGRLVGQILSLLLFVSTFPPGKLACFAASTAGELLRLGLPMIPSFASLFVLQQGNRYILSLFADLDTVGVYTVGTQLGSVVGLAVAAFNIAWTPYFMSFVDRQGQAPRAFARVTTYYVLGFGSLGLLCYGAARPALMVLTHQSFHSGYGVAGHAATAQLFMGVFSLLLPACCFAKEIHYTSLIQIAAAILAVGFNLLLIPPFGMSGAAVALFLGPLSMVLLLWVWNRWRGADYLQIEYEWKRILPFVGLYALIAALLVQPRDWSFGSELLALAATVVAIVVGVSLLLDREERRSLLVGLTSLAGISAAGPRSEGRDRDV